VRITALGIAVMAALLVAALYAASLFAVQTTTLIGSATWANSSSVRTNARGDALFAGAMTAIFWTGLVALAVGLVGGSLTALTVGLVLGFPVGLVGGWQVGLWQAAVSWAHSPGSLVLGDWRSGRFFVRRPYTVTATERMRHVVCSGSTGTGKSTLVRNLIRQDLRAGRGICVIDPKDDLIDGVLPHVPASRLDDVILLDATDTERPLGLNPFAGVPQDQRSLAASELIAVFRRYFADAWGARMEHVLRHVVLALLEVPGATLLDVPRLLIDRSYSRWVAGQVTNPAVREFLLVEYETVLRRRGDVIEPILNKVGPWLAYPELRNIVGQPRNAFDFRRIMDEGKVLLVRIPQGALGEDVSNLLGALVVARLQLAAASRVDVPVHRRRPFYLYVDEFQNFATSSFTKILTEARAFGLGLVCVHQYPEQLTRDLQLSLARNAATFAQAVHLRGRYMVQVTRQEDLQEKKPPVYVVVPPPPLSVGDSKWAERVCQHSRDRYGATPLGIPTVSPPAGETSEVAAGRSDQLLATRDIEEE
jgi:hypothetical protein